MGIGFIALHHAYLHLLQNNSLQNKLLKGVYYAKKLFEIVDKSKVYEAG